MKFIKRETIEKIKGTAYRIGQGIKERIIPCSIGAGIGMLAYGYVSGIINSVQIDDLRDKVTKLDQNQKRLVEWGDHVSETHNRFVDWTHEEIEKLQAENRVLMSEALRRTEGKG